MLLKRIKTYLKSGLMAISFILFFCTSCCFICSCKKEDEAVNESASKDLDDDTSAEEKKGDEIKAEEQWKKGYDLPVDENERKESENDCSKMMEAVYEIYKKADKGMASNVILSDKTISEMQKKLAETKCPIFTMVAYSDMENYEIVENFLNECMEGKTGFLVVYKIHDDGGIARLKFSFDGKDMYVLNTRGKWNEDKTEMPFTSYTRTNTWKYTQKGWFCYELCVPQPPEVTEIVNGSCIIRVKPMTEKNRELSEKCVKGLGYQGNNILCSNWDENHVQDLDYNGVYEYLYAIEYNEKFNPDKYTNGIPKDEFENLIMKYLPVTKKQIQMYAVFDEKNQTYKWVQLGCYNYAPSSFGVSLPEVTEIKENEDGTVTLTVDAICDMVLCSDAVITHELTVKFDENGNFRYLGNKILDDGITRIPDYEYRLKGAQYD